jgi:hypothetical protein
VHLPMPDDDDGISAGVWETQSARTTRMNLMSRRGDGLTIQREQVGQILDLVMPHNMFLHEAARLIPQGYKYKMIYIWSKQREDERQRQYWRRRVERGREHEES